MTWLDDNKIEYSGKKYHKTWPDKYPGNREESILIDSLDDNLSEIIRATFDRYFSRFFECDLSNLTNSPETKSLRNEIAKTAYDCSNELRDKMPVFGFPSYADFLNNKEYIIELQRKEYPGYNDKILLWSYYLDNMKGGKRLSEISSTGFMDCVGHSLAIKMALGSNGFSSYNERDEPFVEDDLFVRLPILVHTMTALKLGDYFLRIDPLHDKGNNHETFLNYKIGFNKSFTRSNVV